MPCILPRTLLLAAFTLLAACAGSSTGTTSDSGSAPTEQPAGPWDEGEFLAAEPQGRGDPDVGRDMLLGGPFMTCGIPWKIWENPAFQGLISQGFGGGPDAPNVPGREGKNAELPYCLNVFEAQDGAEVVNANWLLCHGGQCDGELVIGLGNANADFTSGFGNPGTSGALPPEVLATLSLDEKEEAHFTKMLTRGAIIGDTTAMRTIGMNPAEVLAVVLMVHHDRDTLEWSDDELAPIVRRDHDGNVLPDYKRTSDPPPWWRVHKKTALFYNGMARGDHRCTMALATSVCVDDVEQARRIDAWFRDIQAFVDSVRAPKYPRAIDAALASEGEEVFVANRARCHGTYSENEADETYPNLLIPLDVIGTDPAVAESGAVHSPELVEWYNASFYGEITQVEPNDPFPGYMPPPLDGIWATAPFLHNGSVPTAELLLNSGARPTRWRRFDLDTTYWSQANTGHPFGDHLTREERRAVIEYLKTV
ncbi:MAG: hypothetical protein P8R42_14095 [Candidatus Binatia bacterium]|nr:hypothetical protein [Candidatus Binatia bacterium]